MDAISADLEQRYAFEARAFGQPVALSEVIAAIQAVPVSWRWIWTGSHAQTSRCRRFTRVPMPIVRPWARMGWCRRRNSCCSIPNH